MDDSVRQESPPAVGASSVERRSVRRKLVQSTLFPHNPQLTEPTPDTKKDDENGNKHCNEDEAGGGEEKEEPCGSQIAKRKRRGRPPTPQKKPSPAKKEKRAVNRTPTKSARKLISSIDLEESPPPVPNLRLEAKLTAEENSRIFAGKQIHPFFSSFKSGRKCEKLSEAEDGLYSSEGNKKGITIGPVHVFEKTQDDIRLPLDWKNWKFYENDSASGARDLEGTTSVFEGNISSLTFDELLFVENYCNESFFNNKESIHRKPDEERCSQETSSTDLAGQSDEHVSCSLSQDSELGHETDRVRFISTHAEHLNKLDVKQQFKLLQERMVYYYVDRGNKPTEMLWTDKYQPKKSNEVCGNVESVKFLREWLHLWHQRHQRHHQNSNYINGKENSGSVDNSNSYHLPDSDSEYTEEEGGLKNVLVITGPVGCGKSAAIYACAEEQGFDVMEVNASDCRNGSLVKQRFGEALESHGMKWSLGDDTALQKENKNNSSLPSGMQPIISNEVLEVIQISNEDTSDDAIRAEKFAFKEHGVPCEKPGVKPLILFEDVDIIFLEDRGFISAIEQIADTAKGPLILTTNNSSVSLPGSLDRIEMSFTMPSPVELVQHAYMVCAAEKLSIHPHLIERLVECFKGDIRKTLMHLQFWCQGNRYEQGDESSIIYGAGLFDLELFHNVMPKLMPWNFPSELSELIEEEIAISLSEIEDSFHMEVVERGLDKQALVTSSDVDHSGKALEARKEVMLSRNASIYEDQEYAMQSVEIPCEFSKSPGTPVAFNHRKSRRKLDLVISSDSEDEEKSIIPCLSVDHQSSLTPSSPSIPTEGKAEDKEFGFSLHSGIKAIYENDSQCKASVDDLSCVPESTYVPETAIENETDTVSCRTITSAEVEMEMEEIFTCNGLSDNLSPNHGKPFSRLRKLSDSSRITQHTTAETFEEEELSPYEHAEPLGRGYQVMDECSHMDFRRKAVPDGVHESWKRLRGKDLRKNVSMEERNALRIIRKASGMSSLISESDMLLCKCGAVVDDCLDPRKFVSEEPEFFGWCHEQQQITSTMFQHGVCSYVKDIATVGLKMDHDGPERVDLTSEMMSFTNDQSILAKMIVRNVGGLNRRLPHTSDMSKREAKSCLSDVIQSLIPSRICLSLRGNAFHEYLSSLGNISRIEASRLSHGTNNTKSRRRRTSGHYLSTGKMMLSPEDISLLNKCNIMGYNELQSTEVNNR